MKAPNWQQNVLLVSDDPEIKSSILPAFGSETQFISALNTNEAIRVIGKQSVNVLIIDAKTTNPQLHYYEQIFDENEEVPFIELSQYAAQINNGLTIILLVNKLRAKDGHFARKCGAVLIMDRKTILINRMVYLIEVLRKRTFRTVFARDIPDGTVFPVDVFSYLSRANRYVLLLPAGESFSAEKKEKVINSNTRHLYVLEKDLSLFLSSLRTQSEALTFSESLASIRNQYRQLLIQIFDLSTDGILIFGKELYDKGLEIILQLERLIERFPTITEAMNELPYPRFSAIAHGLNCAMYSLIFAEHCGFENKYEIAFGAMIHNIGFSELDQKLIRKKEEEMSKDEFEEYKKHVFFSMEILKRKLFPFTPLIEKIILSHHENYDGTGFPEGLAGNNIPQEVALVSILGSFDYFNTVKPSEKPLSPSQAWSRLKEHHNMATMLNRKFNPALLKDIDDFFLKNFLEK
jgi:HD-GYP domain-containing protein (c-di-GMP phosphodiesterase class II)